MMETPKYEDIYGPKKQDEKESTAYKFGNEVLGPILVTIVLLFAFALPIWIFWNETLCDVFPLFNRITYLDSFSLCVLIWCIGRVWKGAPNGKKQN